MPSLHAFGRRWNIASDDFVFPGLTDLFVRGAWVLVLVVIFILHNPFECASFTWLPLVIIMIALNILSGGLSMTLAILSAQGSILETQRRRQVPILIYARLPVFLGELAWAIVATMIAFNVLSISSEICRISTGIRIAVLLQWVLIVSLLVGAIIVFNPLDGRRMDRSLVDERLYWRRRFFLCKMGQDSQVREALDDIAALLAKFFVDSDFVLSDIIAGLLLLVHSPHKRVPAILEIDEKTTRSPPEWMKLPGCLELANRYLAFSVAAYGWPHYVVTNCACGSWCLLCRQLCKRRANTEELVVVDDNCCSCHSSAFMLKLDSDCRLSFLSFRNNLFEVPFAVLVDHKTRAIIIPIRGSASFIDIITDLSLTEELLGSVDVDSDPILRADKELDGHGQVRVHKGILRGARYVYETLQSNHVLEDLHTEFPHYPIVICGHSLGGGIGSLLALLLKAKYPDIRCYAFGPPPVISENGLADTERFTLSIVLGDDAIPRMTYQSINLLKADIEREIASTDNAKYEILIKGIFKLFISYPFELHRADADTLSTRNFCQLGTSDCQQPEGSTENGSGEEEQKKETIQVFRPPGRLLHISCPDKETVETRWLHPSALAEIQLTSSMIRDHLPLNIEKALRRAAKQWANEEADGQDRHNYIGTTEDQSRIV